MIIDNSKKISLIAIPIFVILFFYIGCKGDVESEIEDNTGIDYKYQSRSNFTEYETETIETPLPEIPGWFPDDNIFRIPEDAFDTSRSGHPWLAVATSGYLEIRNAPGYNPTPIRKKEETDTASGENESNNEDETNAERNSTNYGSSITGSLKRAQPFWITDKSLNETSGFYWYEIISFNEKDGFVYLPRTESYQMRGFAHEKIIPPRVLIYSADASFYENMGEETVPARYGDIFECKDLEIISGELFYVIMIPDFGEGLVRVSDCAVLAEDIFYILYLRSSRIYDYPRQLTKLEEVLWYFIRVDWFLARYPNSINAPLVLYRANYIALAHGSSEKAEEYRKKLIKDYPEDAKRLLNPGA